ncbi:hypothetical protein QR680_003427 [Steinernema hermaphroditum]|uniref:Protein transport protein Sec24C n=1 Tax=Steinernema hermaphroditum TaxID=289476 RepID=A0AA39LJQ5_9BILA|nr:hypothetical protein QR680_003427 [Steinernema hermaphroditum]
MATAGPHVGMSNPLQPQMNASNTISYGVNQPGMPGMPSGNHPIPPTMQITAQNASASVPSAQMAQMRLSNGSQQHPTMSAPTMMPPTTNNSIQAQQSLSIFSAAPQMTVNSAHTTMNASSVETPVNNVGQAQPSANSIPYAAPPSHTPSGANTAASHPIVNPVQPQQSQNMLPPIFQNSLQSPNGMSMPNAMLSTPVIATTQQPQSAVSGIMPPGLPGMPTSQGNRLGMPQAVQNGPSPAPPMGMPHAVPQYQGMGPPGMVPPRMSTSGLAHPGIGSPGMDARAMVAPPMGTSGMPGLGMPAPGMTGPVMPAPGMPAHGMTAPGMTAPGMMPHGMGAPGFGAGLPGRPGMPGGGFMQEPRKLDPNAMPSVIQVVEDDRSTRTGMFPTGYPTAEPPPLVTTPFTAQDQGNCNPKYMRSTLYAVPQNQDMIKQSQIPFSVAISPFANLLPNEKKPPIVDLRELGPVRCQRCKAYICAFMEFQDGGRRFRCPFCQSSTSVDDSYFCHVDHTGRRTDIQYRPELCLGSYEFVATKPYCRDGVQPKQPAFIFMLDVSYNSVRSGVVSRFCENLVSILQDLPIDAGRDKSEVQIGLVTYDHCIHFYNLMNPSGQPEMLVVNDVEDVFVPFIDGFLVPFEKALPALTECLEQIVAMFTDTRITESILGPVVQAGVDALKCSDRAGKLFIFHSSLPTFEAPGKLKNREDRKALATDREKTVLTPANDFYTKLGEECVKYGCAVDLFLFPSGFVDVASISPLSSLTGGSIYKYQYFDVQRDGQRFLSDLRRDVSREIAFDVMMRVRTSTGIRPTGFYGSFYMQNATDMEIGSIDSDKAIQVDIKHDDKLKDGEFAYVQVAVLFTSCTDYNQLYRVADQDSLVTYLLKTSLKALKDKNPKEMQGDLRQRCAQILATYREKCSDTAPIGQLILPECLKLLPLYVNCILRHEALSGGAELTVDDRAWQMQLVESCRVQEALELLYPRVFEVTSMTLVADAPVEEFTVPTCVRASHENLQSDKAYLIENGLFMFFWVGSTVPQDWINDVFNAASFSGIDSESSYVPERDNNRSRAVRHLIEHIHEGRQRRMKMHVVKQNDSLEAWMKKFLVEDKGLNAFDSYVAFLCKIHKEIRSILT